MNGGHWGELIRADIDPKGHIWVFHQAASTPSPPVMPHALAAPSRRFWSSDPSGKLLSSFGSGMFAFPHGFVDRSRGKHLGQAIANADETVLGKSAKDANGVVRGHQVFKMSPAGKVLLTLGKQGG